VEETLVAIVPVENALAAVAVTVAAQREDVANIVQECRPSGVEQSTYRPPWHGSRRQRPHISVSSVLQYKKPGAILQNPSRRNGTPGHPQPRTETPSS
jgi:hypothetical protein